MPAGGHARAYVESVHLLGVPAFEWTCAEQTVPYSAEARGALVTEPGPVPEQIVTRVQRP